MGKRRPSSKPPLPRARALACAFALVLQALLPVLHAGAGAGGSACEHPEPVASSLSAPHAHDAAAAHDCAACPFCQQGRGAQSALLPPLALAHHGPPAVRGLAPRRLDTVDCTVDLDCSAPRAPPALL